MKTTIAILTLGILIYSGCKDEITKPMEFSNASLLRKQFPASDANSYIQYTYNSYGKISKREKYRNNQLEARYEYFYDEKNNLVKENVFNTYSGVPEYSYHTFEYNEKGLPVKSSTYLFRGTMPYELRSTVIYEYDSNNRIAVENLYDQNGIKTKFREFFYDSRGNVIEINFYQEGKLSFNDKYEYDDMKNPLRFTSTITGAYDMSPNNVVKHTEINYMTSNADFKYEFTYEYNSKNYPVCCISGSSKLIYEYY